MAGGVGVSCFPTRPLVAAERLLPPALAGARPDLISLGGLQPEQRTARVAGKEVVGLRSNPLQGHMGPACGLGRAVQRNRLKFVHCVAGGRDFASADRFARGEGSGPEIAGFGFNDVPRSSVQLP